MITSNHFSHLSHSELHKVQSYLHVLCITLNPERKSIEDLLELGFDLEANLEYLLSEVFIEKCARQNIWVPQKPKV